MTGTIRFFSYPRKKETGSPKSHSYLTQRIKRVLPAAHLLQQGLGHLPPSTPSPLWCVRFLTPWEHRLSRCPNYRIAGATGRASENPVSLSRRGHRPPWERGLQITCPTAEPLPGRALSPHGWWSHWDQVLGPASLVFLIKAQNWKALPNLHILYQEGPRWWNSCLYLTGIAQLIWHITSDLLASYSSWKGHYSGRQEQKNPKVTKDIFFNPCF